MGTPAAPVTQQPDILDQAIQASATNAPAGQAAQGQPDILDNAIADSAAGNSIGSTTSAASQPTIGPSSASSTIQNAAFNKSFPFVHPIDAANAAVAPLENFTPQGKQEHPIEAAIGNLAGGILGLTVGNPNHPEHSIGSGKYGVATNPVGAALAGPITEAATAVPGVDAVPGMGDAETVANAGLEGNAEGAAVPAKPGVITRAGQAVSDATAQKVSDAKEIARQMLVGADGKAEKIIATNNAFKEAYPHLAKLLPILGVAAGGGTLLGTWELFKSMTGFGSK